MTCKGSTGSGVTLTLSVDATIAKIRNVQLPEWLIQAVDFTGLSNVDWMCSIPGAPKDPGGFSAELFLDTEIALPTVGAIQVATFTIPVQTAGNAVPATLSGSGFISGLGFGNAELNQPLLQTMAFRFDGNGTPPAWTLEAAA